ncbi:unnamed protein product [Laminaria digitata]
MHTLPSPFVSLAWRGDVSLLKQLLAAGAGLEVQGVSRGQGPHGPLEWAELKNRPVTAAFLRSLAAKKGERRGKRGGRVDKGAVKAQGSLSKNGGGLDGDVVQS